MFKIVKLILVLSISSSIVQAQEVEVPPSITANRESKDINSVDKQAQPSYSYSAFMAKNVRYPSEAMDANVQGKIYVKFVVEADGSISNAEVVRGAELGHGLAEEALRVFNKMPNWKPAFKDGKAVRSALTMPIVFKLEEDIEEVAPTVGMASPKDDVKDENYIYDVVDDPAKSGYDWQKYLSKTLKYPKEAAEGGYQGKILVKFTVTKTGEIRDIQVVRGGDAGGGLPEEAMRVIEIMPKWIPGKVKGVPVNSYYTTPIVFRLQ